MKKIKNMNLKEINKEIKKYHMLSHQEFQKLNIKEFQRYEDLFFQRSIKKWEINWEKTKIQRYILTFFSIIPLIILFIICSPFIGIQNINVEFYILILFLSCIPIGSLIGYLSTHSYPTRNTGGKSYFTMGYYTEEL